MNNEDFHWIFIMKKIYEYGFVRFSLTTQNIFYTSTW